MSIWEKTSTVGVRDYALNPILKPRHFAEWIIGDPTVIIYNNEIHLWANEIFHGITHYSAPLNDVFNFTQVERTVPYPGATRPFVLKTNESIILYFEQYTLCSLYRASHLMYIEAKPSTGGWNWSHPRQVLKPLYRWEKIGTHRVGNPFVFFNTYKKKWWLYYSASSIHLKDSKIDEPIYIGLAEADTPKGPWHRISNNPLVVESNKYTIGIGSLKVFKHLSENHLLGFCNRITRNSSQITGSTISFIESTDGGFTWRIKQNKLIAPTFKKNSWKKAYIYGYDFLDYNKNYLLMYYNARNNWRGGVETIGVSRISKRILK